MGICELAENEGRDFNPKAKQCITSQIHFKSYCPESRLAEMIKKNMLPFLGPCSLHDGRQFAFSADIHSDAALC